MSQPEDKEESSLPPPPLPKGWEHFAIYPWLIANIVFSGLATLAMMGMGWIVLQVGHLLFPLSLPWEFQILEELGLIEGVVIFLVVLIVGLVVTLKKANELIDASSKVPNRE